MLSQSAWDPVRGHHQFEQTLWPAQTLVDWYHRPPYSSHSVIGM